MARIKIIRGTNLPDTATKTDCHNLVDDATADIYDIVGSEIKSDAAIVDTKLATISTVGKVNLSALTITGQTTGDILYINNAGAVVRLPIGTAGQKLRTTNVQVDFMEYSSDALAQAAYVTNSEIVNDDTTYTKLLIHFDGADADQDNQVAATGQTITTAGTAQLDTAQKKFGTASMLFDGNSDYAYPPDSTDWTFGKGTFTVDFLVRASATTGDIIDTRDISSSPGDTSGFAIVFSGNKFGIYYNDAVKIIDTSSASADTWYHIAIVGNGGADGARTIKMYKDGTQIGSTYTVNYNFSNNVFKMGANAQNTAFLTGWLDEVRVSKGVERWTADFTPPTYAYRLTSDLQSYSEATLKTQGSYALKGVALITSSLNKTLTRTISTPLDLTGKNSIRFDIRSSRTGSNIKIGIHDSGGTTTEVTPNITSANAWQTVTWDISGVSDANKNVIDSIIITIVNADAANTFYLDYFCTEAAAIPLAWVTP